MKDKLFKFKINDVQYGGLMEYDLDAIKRLIGPFEIVKTRRTLLFGNRLVWVRKKSSTVKTAD